MNKWANSSDKLIWNGSLSVAPNLWFTPGTEGLRSGAPLKFMCQLQPSSSHQTRNNLCVYVRVESEGHKLNIRTSTRNN